MKKVNKKSQNAGKKEVLTKTVLVEDTQKKSKIFWILGGVAVVAVAGYAFLQWCCPEKQIKFTPKGAVKESVVVAVIDGEKLRLEDLEAIKNSVPQLKEIPMETVFNNLLDTYVNGRVIVKAAEKSGVQKRPEVKKAIEEAKEQILSRAYLAEQLQARMTPEKARAIYAEELKSYVPQDEIHARHI